MRNKQQPVPSSKKYNQRLGSLDRYTETAGGGSHDQSRLPRARIRRLGSLDRYAETAGGGNYVQGVGKEIEFESVAAGKEAIAIGN